MDLIVPLESNIEKDTKVVQVFSFLKVENVIKLMSYSCSLAGRYITVISVLFLLPQRKLFINDI